MSGMDRLTELLPCPFCGGTEADGSIERAHGTKYVMHSESDDCAAFRGVLIPTQHWNRRAPQKPVAWAETDHKGKVIGVSMNQYPWHPTPLYAQAAPAPSDELAEIDAMLMDGQGDDDGDQVLPGFEPGWSVAAKIEACLHLLEKRRDVICAAQVVDDQLSDGGVTERAHTDLALALSEVSTARHPAPSDGLREAWIAGRDAAASVVAEGWAENRYQEEIDAALIALTPPAALTPAPAQDGGE